MYGKKIIAIMLCFAMMVSFVACDSEEGMKYLMQASQEDVVSFLSLHEDTIRGEYEEWKGSVIDFSVGYETPISVFEKKTVDFSMTMEGKFLIDHQSYISYFYETLTLLIGSIPFLQIVCMGYLDDSDTIYYDQYIIDGLLLSNQYHYISLDTGSVMDAKKWMDYFSPTDFLFKLYDYSFDELSALGEKFYFDNSKGKMTCKVEHSIDYLYREQLLDWKKIGEIFPDDYLSSLGIDWEELVADLSQDGAIDEFRREMEEMSDYSYYTIYEFDKDNLSGAEIAQSLADDNGTLTTHYNVKPLNQQISFDPGAYEKKTPFIDISNYFENVDIDSVMSRLN